MILSREDFMSQLKGRIGDDTSDEAISFLENMTDTYNDLESKVQGDGVDWKAKYEENEASWKKRYTERFFSGRADGDEALQQQIENVQGDGEVKTFEELFIEREG